MMLKTPPCAIVVCKVIGEMPIKKLRSPGLIDMNLFDRSFDQSGRSRLTGGPRRLSALIGRLIMTRMSTFCVMSSTLAALALSANGASAGNVQLHVTIPTVKVPKAGSTNGGGSRNPALLSARKHGQETNATVSSGGDKPGDW
jgi:hypothetical protein